MTRHLAASLDRRTFLRLGGLTGTGALLGTSRLPSVTASQPRVHLAHLPTALEELPRLSAQLAGPRLLIKRDDQTGLATGGNKTRKLEYLVAAARGAGADTLITSGSVQSNHCRQTAAAAARSGLHCVLLLRGEDTTAEGNLLLDQLLGAEVRIGNQTFDEAAEDLRSQGRKPYVVPVGGSNGTGATGYVTAMEELMEQLRDRGDNVDWIITASGSGGTQGGMAVGARAHGYAGRILGVAVSRGADGMRSRLADVANETAAHLRLDERFEPDQFHVSSDFLGGGYGVMSDLERGAIHTLAKTEGILLDPVYTGRAFGGMLRLIEEGFFQKDETVLFWHTGGTPALFADKYATVL